MQLAQPCLQPVTGEEFKHRIANREDSARLDIIAQSFWGRDRQCAFFDLRVFNTFAQSCRNTPLGQCYRYNELDKWRAYNERVREVEHWTFSPLVFSTTGGMGNTAKVIYTRELPHSLQTNRASHTARHCTGSNTDSVFRCFVQR